MVSLQLALGMVAMCGARDRGKRRGVPTLWFADVVLVLAVDALPEAEWGGLSIPSLSRGECVTISEL